VEAPGSSSKAVRGVILADLSASRIHDYQNMRLLLITLLLFTAACQDPDKQEKEKWSELPGVTNISHLRKTEFVPALESPINLQKNFVYATAFLYAWDKVKDKLGGPVILSDKNSPEFSLVNQSTFHRNTLIPEEYSAEVEMIDSVIFAKAFFNKTLPFPSKLQKLENPISFGGSKVNGFGMPVIDHTILKFTDILYYGDDDHFILKLSPRDKNHEIYLAKGITNSTTLLSAFNQTKDLIGLGEKERHLSKNAWKYSWNEKDLFSIPVIKFNIEKNYENIESQVFTTNGKKHYVELAYQRTGFILNEHGAVVESESAVMVDSIAAEPVRVHAKKLVFDKPFFVIIKRANNDNPYFVMFVQNDELMVKEK
jgi:hypothetical protein